MSTAWIRKWIRKGDKGEEGDKSNKSKERENKKGWTKERE